MRNKVTISDVAKKTNYSVTTVSRVLNGKAKEYRIGKKSQKIIRQADNVDIEDDKLEISFSRALISDDLPTFERPGFVWP